MSPKSTEPEQSKDSEASSKKPEDFLVHPDMFGEVYDASWWYVGASDAEFRHFLAAVFLHRTAFQVKEMIKRKDVRRADIWKRAKQSDGTLRRKLNGSSWPSVADVLIWAETCGVDVLPPMSSRQDFVPKRVEHRPESSPAQARKNELRASLDVLMEEDGYDKDEIIAMLVTAPSAGDAASS